MKVSVRLGAVATFKDVDVTVELADCDPDVEEVGGYSTTTRFCSIFRIIRGSSKGMRSATSRPCIY